MKNQLKRIISTLLIIILCCSVLPYSIFANEFTEEEIVTTITEEEINDVTEDETEDLFEEELYDIFEEELDDVSEEDLDGDEEEAVDDVEEEFVGELLEEWVKLYSSYSESPIKITATFDVTGQTIVTDKDQGTEISNYSIRLRYWVDAAIMNSIDNHFEAGSIRINIGKYPPINNNTHFELKYDSATSEYYLVNKVAVEPGADGNIILSYDPTLLPKSSTGAVSDSHVFNFEAIDAEGRSCNGATPTLTYRGQFIKEVYPLNKIPYVPSQQARPYKNLNGTNSDDYYWIGFNLVSDKNLGDKYRWLLDPSSRMMIDVLPEHAELLAVWVNDGTLVYDANQAQPNLDPTRLVITPATAGNGGTIQYPTYLMNVLIRFNIEELGGGLDVVNHCEYWGKYENETGERYKLKEADAYVDLSSYVFAGGEGIYSLAKAFYAHHGDNYPWVEATHSFPLSSVQVGKSFNCDFTFSKLETTSPVDIVICDDRLELLNSQGTTRLTDGYYYKPLDFRMMPGATRQDIYFKYRGDSDYTYYASLEPGQGSKVPATTRTDIVGIKAIQRNVTGVCSYLRSFDLELWLYDPEFETFTNNPSKVTNIAYYDLLDPITGQSIGGASAEGYGGSEGPRLAREDFEEFGHYVYRTKAECTINNTQIYAGMTKSVKKYEYVNDRHEITYRIAKINSDNISKNRKIYDLLPSGVKYNMATVLPEEVSVTFDNNYKGSGRQMVVFDVSNIKSPNDNFEFKTYIDNLGYYIANQSVENYCVMVHEDTDITFYTLAAGRMINTVNSVLAPNDGSFFTDPKLSALYSDLGGEGNTNEICIWSRATATIDFSGASMAEIDKLVIPYTGMPTKRAVGLLGEPYSYRLQVSTAASAKKNLVIYDVLPFVGDTYYDSSVGRASEWAGIFTGVDAYHDEYNPTIWYATDLTGLTTLDNGGWTTIQPEDLSTVKAVAFDYRAYEIPEGMVIYADIHMISPRDISILGKTNFNNFYYEKQDYNTIIHGWDPLVVLQNNKVSYQISSANVSIGNVLFNDANRNGIKEVTEEYAVGTVKLYKVDPAGEVERDGKLLKEVDSKEIFYDTYSFRIYEAGEYYVRFITLDGTWAFTTLYGGEADSAKELNYADAAGWVNKTFVVTRSDLSSGKQDYTFDAGIYKMASSITTDVTKTASVESKAAVNGLNGNENISFIITGVGNHNDYDVDNIVMIDRPQNNSKLTSIELPAFNNAAGMKVKTEVTFNGVSYTANGIQEYDLAAARTIDLQNAKGVRLTFYHTTGLVPTEFAQNGNIVINCKTSSIYTDSAVSTNVTLDGTEYTMTYTNNVSLTENYVSLTATESDSAQTEITYLDPITAPIVNIVKTANGSTYDAINSRIATVSYRINGLATTFASAYSQFDGTVTMGSTVVDVPDEELFITSISINSLFAGETYDLYVGGKFVENFSGSASKTWNFDGQSYKTFEIVAKGNTILNSAGYIDVTYKIDPKSAKKLTYTNETEYNLAWGRDFISDEDDATHTDGYIPPNGDADVTKTAGKDVYDMEEDVTFTISDFQVDVQKKRKIEINDTMGNSRYYIKSIELQNVDINSSSPAATFTLKSHDEAIANKVETVNVGTSYTYVNADQNYQDFSISVNVNTMAAEMKVVVTYAIKTGLTPIIETIHNDVEFIPYNPVTNGQEYVAEAEAETLVRPTYDMQLEKKVVQVGDIVILWSDDEAAIKVKEGQTIKYGLKITNLGDAPARPEKIVEYLGYNGNCLVLDDPNWDIEDNGYAYYTWTDGLIEPGESKMIYATFRIPDGANGSIRNLAEIYHMYDAGDTLIDDGELNNPYDDVPDHDCGYGADDAYIVIDKPVVGGGGSGGSSTPEKEPDPENEPEPEYEPQPEPEREIELPTTDPQPESELIPTGVAPIRVTNTELPKTGHEDNMIYLLLLMTLAGAMLIKSNYKWLKSKR